MQWLAIVLILVLVGLIAGVASGMLGIGGGIIMVPALVLGFELSVRDAVAAGLLVMVLATPFGILRHHRARNVRLPAGIWLGLSGFVGVLIGTWAGQYMDDSAILMLFSAVLVVSSERLVYGRAPHHQYARAWPMVPFGLAAGFAAKVLGIGGGIITVPGLVFLGYGMHAAVATSLLAVWTNALFATSINLIHGGSWWQASLPLAAGSIVGVQLGAAHALRSHADSLRRVFGILLVLMAILLFQRSVA